jgi:hypothetical protein
MAVAIEPGQAAQVEKTKQAAVPKPPAVPEAPPYSVELKTPVEMVSLLTAWEDLARDAVEPNPFYEPWMLREALNSFGSSSDLIFVVVNRRLQSPKVPPQMVGLFPIERFSRYRGAPIKTWKLWKHLYCFHCVPLLRKGHLAEALDTFFEWAGQDRQAPALLEWSGIVAEGPFYQALIDTLRARGNTTFALDTYNRAIFRPAADPEAYCAAGMTCHNRQEQRRQRRRLEEMGRLEFRTLSQKQDVDAWVDIFLQMESSGWKGQEHTALAADLQHADYFRRISHSAFERGQLMMLGLFLDDRPIAAKCNFKTGAGSFAFKIGFDESLSKFSPGVQLELENIRIAHEIKDLQWMDSCAAPTHFMINRLWKDRRTVQRLLISTGRRSSELLLAIIPFWRGLKKFVFGNVALAKKAPIRKTN